MNRFLFRSLLFLGLLIQANVVSANERRFAYTYETSTLPPGVREIELWNTYRTDKGFFYRRLDQRVEYEFGITNNLMSALYLNNSWKLQDSNGGADSGNAMASSEVSISSEWKYKLMDRVADPIGFALYGEATLGLNEVELEGKILFDKQIDNFLFAFNGVIEHEWETELELGETEIEKELVFEFNFGATYFISNSFSVGVEARNHNEVKDGTWEHSALFLGPALSYSTEEWWATLTVLPQITAFKGATKGNLVLDEHEKMEARLLFSFHL